MIYCFQLLFVMLAAATFFQLYLDYFLRYIYLHILDLVCFIKVLL